jgi:hypothetical protein
MEPPPNERSTVRIRRRFEDATALLRRFLLLAAARGDDWNGGAKLDRLLEEARAYLEEYNAAPGDFGHCPEPVL